ncbi:hypothetical protein P4284_24445 [Bacillus swezeyi]|uniref:hypothetical protein n=1 Tax=Bacillus swezeyi TaxID=1925020 RepID=UPI002E218214|nr:hypothetical protein [Bacillus swezeyi]MED2979793.1 hypothetical protein [Bacillus swezeyi]
MIYESFWKGIVENDDGTFNTEQVKKELCDYKNLLENASQVYSSFTRYSNPMTDSQFVIDEINEKYIRKDILVEDIKEIAAEGVISVEEIKELLK